MPLISCASGKFLLAHMTEEQVPARRALRHQQTAGAVHGDGARSPRSDRRGGHRRDGSRRHRSSASVRH
ncbi:hypothetical protein JBE27_00355 [Streptomyces albiflaviniger]|nr:hypothetical protein [Streptomyces albiflaviniger]